MNEKTAISGGSSFFPFWAHLPFRGTNHRSFEARLVGPNSGTTSDVAGVYELFMIKKPLNYELFIL